MTAARVRSLALALFLASATGVAAQQEPAPADSAIAAAGTAAAPVAPPSAGGIGVTARPSKLDVTLGERFTVQLDGVGPDGITWTFPTEVPGEAVELRPPPPPANPKDAPPPLPPGRMVWEAQAFAMEGAEIPAITVRYRLADGTEGEVSSAPVPLRVLSVLPRDEEEPRLADIRPPVGVGPGREFWVALGVLLLGLGLAVWAWRRRKRPAAAAVPAAPPTPADEEARAALAKLRASGLLRRGEYRLYYIQLAEVAKRYLERRLEAPVLEMTSSEMVAFVREHPAASAHAPALRDLAGAADRIKFARGSGLVEEGERHAAEVEKLVATVEAAFAPPPPAPPAKAPGRRR